MGDRRDQRLQRDVPSRTAEAQSGRVSAMARIAAEAWLARPMFVAPGEGERLNVLGDNLTVTLPSECTGGLLTLAEVDSLPGGGFPPHRRDREDVTFYV